MEGPSRDQFNRSRFHPQIRAVMFENTDSFFFRCTDNSAEDKSTLLKFGQFSQQYTDYSVVDSSASFSKDLNKLDLKKICVKAWFKFADGHSMHALPHGGDNQL